MKIAEEIKEKAAPFVSKINAKLAERRAKKAESEPVIEAKFTEVPEASETAQVVTTQASELKKENPKKAKKEKPEEPTVEQYLAAGYEPFLDKELIDMLIPGITVGAIVIDGILAYFRAPPITVILLILAVTVIMVYLVKQYKHPTMIPPAAAE